MTTYVTIKNARSRFVVTRISKESILFTATQARRWALYKISALKAISPIKLIWKDLVAIYPFLSSDLQPGIVINFAFGGPVIVTYILFKQLRTLYSILLMNFIVIVIVHMVCIPGLILATSIAEFSVSVFCHIFSLFDSSEVSCDIKSHVGGCNPFLPRTKSSSPHQLLCA